MVQSLGWTWPEFGILRTQFGQSTSLAREVSHAGGVRRAALERGEDPASAAEAEAQQRREDKKEDSEWEHTIRDGLRRREWRLAAARRQDKAGIADGIDRKATVALHEKKGELTE